MSNKLERNKEKSEYSLRVLKIPRQFIDVFARNIERGDYGLSSETVDTLFEYVQLQNLLASINDLTFTQNFIGSLPEKFKSKLKENLHPGIQLAELEIPMTDKVILLELLAADALTDILSNSFVEIWITPDVQKRLIDYGFIINEGLQQLDYSQFSLEAKSFLLGVMEYQEMQVHTILLANERFPEGVPAVTGVNALFSSDEDNQRTITFNSLEDIENQYEAAREALDNPINLFFGQIIQQMRKDEHKKPEINNATDLDDSDYPNIRPKIESEIDIETIAKDEWWLSDQYENNMDVIKKISNYLRKKYAGKTIYEIFEAITNEERQEILSAFWRTHSRKHIDLGDEGWIENNLYLKQDGTLELHHSDDIYNARKEFFIAPGSLDNYIQVAMVDQTVKWIREELKAMQIVKEKWKLSSLSEVQPIEFTFVNAIGRTLSSEVLEEVLGLPDWFVDVLNQELRYYRILPMRYTSEQNIDDIFSLSLYQKPKSVNLLKMYLISSQNNIMRYRNLFMNPEEMYKILDLDASATDQQVKDSFRKIAKETKAIHISSSKDFDPILWNKMNQRFTEAVKAYSVLTKHKRGDRRIVTLGRLTSYFEIT